MVNFKSRERVAHLLMEISGQLYQAAVVPACRDCCSLCDLDEGSSGDVLELRIALGRFSEDGLINVLKKWVSPLQNISKECKV